MTSVKEIRVDRGPGPRADPGAGVDPGAGRFVFSDDYSVFDWGRMPDAIPDKGAALCTMGAHNFELLDVNHVPTHYRGVYEEPGDEGEPLELGDCAVAPRAMAIELTRTPELPHVGGGTPDVDDPDGIHAGYDYGAYRAAAGDDYLIPLEIVFRNRVPLGSSLRERGSPADFGVDPDDLDGEDGDGDGWPDEPVALPEPIVEFSTKFEAQDRYLDRHEARAIAGDASLDRLEELALAVDHVLSREARRADVDGGGDGDDEGLVHEDGKIECRYRDGELQVADVVGTLDENRFAYAGQELSKEVVRQYYRREHPDWVDAVATAKREAREAGVADWRGRCPIDPPSLPDDVVATVAEMYAATTNAYTRSRWFDAGGLDEVVAAIRRL
jgi:phosphoribosylaminoimidazole-succinocarboxamide synthase